MDTQHLHHLASLDHHIDFVWDDLGWVFRIVKSHVSICSLLCAFLYTVDDDFWKCAF